VGTEKRERQKAARLEKISTQATAAKRDRTRGTAIRIAVAAVVVLGILFGVSRLMDDGDSDTATSNDETSTTVGPTDTTTPEYTNPDLAEQVLARQAPTPAPPPADTPATALESTTLIEGEGTGAQTGDVVTVHYAGVLSDGTQFDESWSRGEPFPVTLGAGEVIAGWDQGLVGAKIGERRHLVIGSDNAYGPQGRDPIPPNAPLAFDVDVVDIQTPAG
jgi:FKBP-type peptidyl-prolyl cis-trans isomerase FkpA